MAKILIVYYSTTGNTEEMAELVKKGVQMEKVEVELKRVEQTNIEDLLKTDGMIIGSPTYYGTMAAPIKELIDQSVEHHGELQGKVGGAFTSSANIGGGNETTLFSILEAFLIHGMVIQGAFDGDHYGPVSIGKPNKRTERECIELGRRVASLVLKIKGE